MVWTFNSGFEYLNLSDASEAEREILRSMLFEGSEEVATKNVLFQFLKPPPPNLSRCESVNDTESSSGRCEFSPGSGHDIATLDPHPHNQNGPSHLNVHLDQSNNEIPNATSPNSLAGHGPQPPQQLRSFYPAGQVMNAPHMQGGPTPMGHHIPISAYQPQMAHGQMIQTPNYYGHPAMAQQYQMLHYGQPTHSYPPPAQYHQADIDHSLNQTHHNQKGHHDSTHSPNPSGGPPKYRNKSNQRPRRNEDSMNHNTYPPFYPNMGYAPVYYNPGIAQTVTNMTGPPLIMPPGGGQPHTTMYAPYPTQSHMYATSPGSDVEHSHGITVVPVELSAEISVPISAQQPTVVTITEKDKPKDKPKSNVNVHERHLPDSLSPRFEKEAKLVVAKEADTKVENDSAVSHVPATIPDDTKVPLKPKPTVLLKPVTEVLPTVKENNVAIPSNQTKPSQPETLLPIKPTVETPDQVNKSKTIKSTNGPTSVPMDSSHQRASSNTSAGKGKYATNAPDFPELGQSGGYSPTPPKSSVANTERSWASIASSKTLNGPSNGIVINSAVVDNGSAQIVSSGVEDNYDGHQYNAQNARASLSNSSIKNEFSTYLESSHDKSSLSDENDPIALHLGEFLTNYSLDHHSLSLTPRGLSNQSNYCYINATLQSLIACPPFVNLFRAMKDVIGKQPCKATPIIQSVYDFVMEFDPITRVSHGNRHKRPSDAFYVGANFEAAGIRRVLGLLDGATFKVEGRQEDAEEFLSHLLNGLHDEMMKVIKWLENKKDRMNSKSSNTVTGPPMSPSMNGDTPEIRGDEDDDQWQVMGPKNKGCMTRKTCFSKSPISEMFVGQMCSALNRTIGLKSTTLQPFFTLQLDIQEDNIHSVRDALEGLSTKEEVTGFTSVTGQETEAWKQLSLEVLPIILILHMKRFVYDKSGNKIHKLDKKVEFPVDLEIGRDLLSINSKGKYTLKQRQYKLFAAVYHDGEEAHKGHYIADCFHPSGGSLWGQFGWIRYDDTAVKGIAENHILNPQPPRVPYLLYYRRVDTLSPAKKERL